MVQDAVELSNVQYAEAAKPEAAHPPSSPGGTYIPLIVNRHNRIGSPVTKRARDRSFVSDGFSLEQS